MESVDELQSVITTMAMADGEDAAIELFESWLFQSEPVKKEKPGKVEKNQMVETQYAITVIGEALDRLTAAVKRIAAAVESANHQAHDDRGGFNVECPICTGARRNG